MSLCKTRWKPSFFSFLILLELLLRENLITNWQEMKCFYVSNVRILVFLIENHLPNKQVESEDGKSSPLTPAHVERSKQQTFRLYFLIRCLPLLGRRASHVLNLGWILVNPCCCLLCEHRFAVEMMFHRPWRLLTTTMSWKLLVLGWKPHPLDYCFDEINERMES